jgi:hypothetical protein
MSRTFTWLSVLCVSSLLAFTPRARAAYVMSIQQSGTDVTATGNGSIDSTDLAYNGGFGASCAIKANVASFLLGPPGGNGGDEYTGLAGPTSFGNGGVFGVDTGSGPGVGLFGGLGEFLVVPSNYASGSLIATTTSAWDNQTFNSLGLDPGTYQWTWGTAVHADTFTLQIGPAATSVPLPLSAYAAILCLPAGFVFRKKFAKV